MNMTTMTTPEEQQPKFEFRFWGSKPGHVTSADMPGHMIPALIYFIIGAAFLLLALQRAQDYLTNYPGKSYAQLFIPEKSTAVIRTFGRGMMITCIIGEIEHTGIGIWDKGEPFMFLGHQVMYFAFLVVGLTAELEAQRKLPPDSYRMCLALAFFVNAVMMREHATMKPSLVDGKFHEFWGQLNFANSFALAYSVRNPTSVVAFIMGWALMILTSTWLVTIGLWACCWDVETHMVGTHLGLQTFILALVIILFTAFCCPPLEDSTVEDQSEYTPLKMKGADPGEEGSITSIHHAAAP